MSCDLLLQGGQFFSSPLVAKYLIVHNYYWQKEVLLIKK